MLKAFKKFADYINSRRIKDFDWQTELEKRLPENGLILEVGSNIRPKIKNGLRRFELHGLDPDPTINLQEANEIFDHFYNIKFEELQTEKKYDLIVLDMVFEHIENNELTFQKFKQVLKKGGRIISHQPSNLHPYVLINRALNHDVKLKVLKLLRPWSGVGVITGWKSYYSHCNVYLIRKLAKRFNFGIKSIKCNYDGSDYFAFFPPLFLAVVIYEEFNRFFKLKFLSSTFFFELENLDENG